MLKKKIKEKLISDYILDYLVSKKVKYVFLLTGGAVAFLIDAFSRRKDIKYIAVAHEQSAAMMADAYSRVGPNYSATMATSGPGATNLITGICCSWFDSIPSLHITGQVNTYEQRGAQKGTKNVRQIGFQETEISSIVKSITKYSVKISDAKKIKYYFEKAYNISQEGRPGPVLIDIPMNFQRMKLNSISFVKTKLKTDLKNKNSDRIKIKIEKILKLIKKSKKPLILVGGGVRLGNSVKELNQLLKILEIPFVAAWSGLDCCDGDNKLFFGTTGVYGNRYANFLVQNCDFLISIGSRLDTRVTGGRPDTFAKKAFKVMNDIDKNELSKRRGLVPNISVESDSKIFINNFLDKIKKNKKFPKNYTNWIKKCHSLKKTFPIVDKKYYLQKKFVNPYVFFETLSNNLNKKDIILADTGAHLTWFMQTHKIKLGQRVISAFGNSPMGYAFPASIGASLASNKNRVISINGEGSFQINIQELQTLSYLKLPVKIFILNNKGYGIIKQFQSLFLEKRFEATSKGYSFPNFQKIANAYKIKYFNINNNKDINKSLKNILKYKGSVLCEVMIKPDQQIIPKLEFGKPIEDLSPLLSRKIFENIMKN